MAYLKQWAPRAAPAAHPAPSRAARRARARPIRGDALERAARPRRVRLRVPRPAVQPAPLRGELPRVGDARGVGRARALRRRLQAGRARRPRPHERVQPPARDARGAARVRRGRRRRGHGRLVQRRVVARRSTSSSTMCARRGVRWRCSPTTRSGTSARRSASTTRRGDRVGTVSRLRNTEYLVVSGNRARGRGARHGCIGPGDASVRRLSPARPDDRARSSGPARTAARRGGVVSPSDVRRACAPDPRPRHTRNFTSAPGQREPTDTVRACGGGCELAAPANCQLRRKRSQSASQAIPRRRT